MATADEIDKVRALIGDTDASNPVYSAADLDGYLGQAAEDYTTTLGIRYKAAALALRALAIRLIMVKGKTRTLDLQVDGVAEAGELKKLAEQYETQADDNETRSDPLFEVIATSGS